MPSRKPYVNNLHHILNDVLKYDYDFWLNIDSDNPPIENPLDLVVLNKDLIGLPTPIWHFTDKKTGERPVYWNAYDYVEEKDAYSEHKEKTGLQRVDAVGTGCFLAHRRIFEGIEAPFMRKWHKDGTVHKGNDMAFCERIREKGHEIYCHYDYPCDHFSELSLLENNRAWREAYEQMEKCNA